MTTSKPPIMQALDAHYFSMREQVGLSQLMSWLEFVGFVAEAIPDMFEKAYEIFAGPDSPSAGPPWSTTSPHLLDVERHAATIRELVYGRVVDRFLYYLVMIVGCIYEASPNLIPDAKVRVSDVVECGSVEALLAQRAHLVAADLSFSSPKLIDTALTLAGVDDGVAEDAATNLKRAVAIRNLLVHHNGVVHARFVRDFPQHADLLGKPFPVDDDLLSELMDLVAEVRDDIDAAMQERHGISAAKLLSLANEYWANTQESEGAGDAQQAHPADGQER